MLHGRADRIARHEAWASMTMGKNVVWLYQQEMGILPKDAMKMWITAEDERVCPICAPMDKKTVPINEKFETTAGQFWTPGVHVNCRCDIRIILPDDRESLRKDWDENKYLRGQPGNRGQFRSKPKPQTSTKEQAADYSRLSDWIDVSLDEVPKKSLFSEPEKKVNAFGIKQSAFTGEKKSAFTSPKTSAFTETAKAPANTFTEQEKKPPVRRRKVVTWVYINGKHERREFEPPDVPEEQQYIKQDGKVAFVPYFGFKSRFQGREHKIVNPWNRESSEQIANIDTTDLEMGSIPVISNAYVENEPIEITGDNLSVIDIPESLRLAIKDSLAQANLWLSEEQKAYERDVVVNEDFDDEEEGSTLGATDNTYNFTPAVVGFSDFYSVNTELDNINSNGSDNVAGTYKIRMAEPSGQEGEIVNHLLTPTDDRKLTFRLSVKDFQSIYNDLSDSKIIWESNSSTSPVYNPDIAKSFPELFFSNPWSDDRWVTVVYAQPTAPPEV